MPEAQTTLKRRRTALQIQHYYYLLLLLFLLPTDSSCMIRSIIQRVRPTQLKMALHETAKRLVGTNFSREKPNYVCVAVAGGGGSAISTLASTPGASSLFLEGTITYDRKSFQAYVGTTVDKDFSYASVEAATMLSRAALRRALQYRSNFDDYSQCIGVGCSSALVSTSSRDVPSYGHIVASQADGSTWTCQVKLTPKMRDRMEEDQVMGDMVLKAIEQLQSEGKEKLVVDVATDVIEEVFTKVEQDDAAFQGAKRILAGEVGAVLLLPTQGNKFVAIADPVLPVQALVFPGSFNPPHFGHTTLAQAATNAWKGQNHAVCLELSLTNPDKPSMEPTDASQRAHHFFDLKDKLPDQWGVLLTSAPLFAQKVATLKPYMAQGMFQKGIIPSIGFFSDKRPPPVVHDHTPQMGFVIGTDTMVRILNPKYYGDSEENMLEAVREMGRSGVHFVVGGRLEQRQGGDSTKFVSGEDEVKLLPKDVQQMFTLVMEDDFRVDISSTELRKRREGSHT
jgi:nicotinic acid mononucleotide adenylyltransferase